MAATRSCPLIRSTPPLDGKCKNAACPGWQPAGERITNLWRSGERGAGCGPGRGRGAGQRPGEPLPLGHPARVAGLDGHLPRRLRGRGELHRHARSIDPPGEDLAGARTQADRPFSPAEMEGELGGATGAVQAEIGEVAVGIEVLHHHAAFGPPQEEQAVPPERDAAPAPGADRLRTGGLRGLRKGQEVVAAAGELVEAAHGTSVRTSLPGPLSLPAWSTAVTR